MKVVTLLARSLSSQNLPQILSHQKQLTYYYSYKFIIFRGMAAKQSSVSFTHVDSWDEYYRKDVERLKKLFSQKDVKQPSQVYSVNSAFNKKVSIWKGDITKLDIDAIVNAANSSLMGGGGVDGAIHRVAGPELKNECQGLGGCSVGEAKITKGYKLPAKYVIHTVGPQGEKPDKLKSCYETSLNVLIDNNLRSVAFPCISTGVFGYPQAEAANVALTTVRKYLELKPNAIDKVIFCLFLPEDVKIYENLLQVYFPIG